MPVNISNDSTVKQSINITIQTPVTHLNSEDKQNQSQNTTARNSAFSTVSPNDLTTDNTDIATSVNLKKNENSETNATSSTSGILIKIT